MDFLLKIAFYGVGAICTAGAVFFLIAALFDNNPYTKARERIFLGSAASVALGLLVQAFRSGHYGAQWGAGLGWIAAAVFAFLLIQLTGVFTGKIHWQ